LQTNTQRNNKKPNQIWQHVDIVSDGQWHTSIIPQRAALNRATRAHRLAKHPSTDKHHNKLVIAVVVIVHIHVIGVLVVISVIVVIVVIVVLVIIIVVVIIYMICIVHVLIVLLFMLVLLVRLLHCASDTQHNASNVHSGCFAISGSGGSGGGDGGGGCGGGGGRSGVGLTGWLKQDACTNDRTQACTGMNADLKLNSNVSFLPRDYNLSTVSFQWDLSGLLVGWWLLFCCER
jgi:hypothetical protein